jgi:hypothetical protein
MYFRPGVLAAVYNNFITRFSVGFASEFEMAALKKLVQKCPRY